MRVPFFGRGAAPVIEEESSCPHLMLTPLWHNAADMGVEAKATGYRCYACGDALTLDEAAEARRRSAISL